MPGIDHDVHDSVRMKDNHRAGCWNLPRKREKLIVKNGFKLVYVGNGQYESVQMFIEIDDFGSVECRYDQRIAPEDCEGCEHINTSYDETIRREGT